ncbi:MAG: protein kinase [Planctomycetes bacterium]|nr:protein kinase [Planctomycetota bacterium]
MDADRPEGQSEPHQRIDALINEYFERRQAGEELSPEAFAAEHRDFEEDLRPYLEGFSLLERIRSDAEHDLDAVDPGPDLPAIDGYRILEEIGRGGMGVVYRAIQRSTKRVVAVKVMLAGPFASPSARRRFEREIELAARLRHANIVRVLESGRAGRQPYYAMDFVSGVPLDEHVCGQEPDVRALLALFASVCDAVEYAHRHDVVHRDLKPANVLVDDGGQPYVLDFGLAKAIGETAAEGTVTARMSIPGQIMGTLPYLSPEQAAGRIDEIDARTDVYALGVMMYEALTGSLPFDATDRPTEIVRQIQEVAPPAPSKRSRHVSSELETIILKALEKEQERRYQSAADLGADVHRLLAGEPIHARRPSSLYVLRKKARKHRIAIALSMVALAVVVSGLIVRARGERRELAVARHTALTRHEALERAATNSVLGSIEALHDQHRELPEARLAWAQAQYRVEETRASGILFLERLIETDESAWYAAALLAEIYERTGDTARARALAERVEHEAADTADGWYLRSLATLDREHARRHAVRAVERDASHVLAWRRLAVLRRDTADHAGALLAADRLIALGSDPVDWTLFRGRLLATQGRFEEAVAEYTRAMQMGPSGAKAYLARAHAYRWLGGYENAVADYDRAIEISGPTTTDVWSLYQRATPLWILGRRTDALEDYRRVRILLGHAFYSDARRFVILRELGRDGEADEVLEAALLDVTDPWLGKVFRCLGGRITPEELVAEGTARDDLEKLCEAYYYAGEACLLARRTGAARTWFERCVETGVQFDPDSTPALPMNEFELARWRLETVAATSSNAGD